ncbi:hypothetical protein K435DRAFT_706780, partial [Dendrothele bispora CBS 962.96]
PILAAYVGDYPEQVLVTCVYSGHCASCGCPKDELGNYPCEAEYRDISEAIEAVKLVGTEDWAQTCLRAKLKPVQHPFWEDLPYTDIFRSITPDILHQLYQGVMKHLIGWITAICGKDEVDARVRRLPLNHGIRNFHKGITTLSRVTGAEHKQICSLLLGLVLDTPFLTGVQSRQLISATRSLLDFLYLACYPIHSDESLKSLEEVLQTFHDNKSIFISLGVRDHFNFPKIHFLCHYVRAIKFYGTTDNYNTETTERLHIDFAKDAYRASNKKDEYSQMTKWLERREKVMHHSNYVAWRCTQFTSSQQQVDNMVNTSSQTAQLGQRFDFPGALRTLTDLRCPYQQKITKFPTVKTVTISKLEDPGPKGYGATKFYFSLRRFIAQWSHPNLSIREQEEMTEFIALPFRSVPVWHQVKFVNPDLYGDATLDVLKAHPRKTNSHDKVIQSRQFDTALIQKRANNPNNGFLDGLCVGRVRVIFSLPAQAIDRLFPPAVTARPPSHLAYVEWFTGFSRNPDASSGLYRIRHDVLSDSTLKASVVPLETIKQSVHLFPKWGGSVPADWSCESVLDDCAIFYVNPFKDLRTYCNFQ